MRTSRENIFFLLWVFNLYFAFIETSIKKYLRKSEQEAIKNFYMAYDRQTEFNRHKTAREDSIQLILQLVLVSHQYFNFPGTEMVYDQSESSLTPTVQWLGYLIVNIISIILSAYETLKFQLDVRFYVKFLCFSRIDFNTQLDRWSPRRPLTSIIYF